MNKTAKKSSVKKSVRTAVVHKKRLAAGKSRPLHKRVLLHPFSIMVLLCAGVLIAGSSIRSFADTVEIKATIQAAPITNAATITSPLDAQHVSSPAIAVTGACEAQSYVKLNLNSVFSGQDVCQSGSYTIPATLANGANQVQVQIYSLTDAPGPATAPITVYYDQTTVTSPPTPSTVPTTIEVSTVEETSYQQGSIPQTSSDPTINGFAPPYSVVTVTFHSVVSTCTTVADATGYWSCTLDHDLPVGVHRVDIVAQTPDGQRITFPTFQIAVLASLANLLVPAKVSSPIIRTNYQYEARAAGQPFTWDLTIDGGQPPYSITVDWGDGASGHSVQPDHSTFAISHAYKTPKNYAVTITAVDASGSIARFQVVAVVNVLAANAGTFTASNTVSSVVAKIRERLWIIWPTYIVVVLMVIGYWLGEREEYQQLMAGRRAHSRSSGRK